MKAQFCVWTWLNDEGEPVYVGWGKFCLTHPAKHVWASRKAYDSELNDWLRTLEREPDRKYDELTARFSRTEASAQANFMRKDLKAKGAKLLDSRPKGTKAGGGAARGVLTPDLEIYESVRQAATALGVHPCTITRKCRTEGSGWDYLN